MNSFTAEIGSRGYHVYRNSTWRNVALHQQVKVLKETSTLSKDIDPYCCKITITRIDRIGNVTVGHIPRELSRFVFYFLHEGGSVSGTVACLKPNVSPIPEGGLEIPILMHFVHESGLILEKMKRFVSGQVERMKQTFNVKELIGDTESDEEELEEIEVESDDNDGDSERIKEEKDEIIVLD